MQLVVLGMIFIFLIFIALAWILIIISYSISLFCGGAPYIAIPRKHIKEILTFGELSSDDIFYELGAGDGRILIAAVEDFSVARAVGYEIAPWPYWRARNAIMRSHLENKIIFLRKNFLQENFSEATFVFLYLYENIVNKKLAPRLADSLKSGATVLSCSISIDRTQYPQFELLKSKKIGSITVYQYRKI